MVKEPDTNRQIGVWFHLYEVPQLSSVQFSHSVVSHSLWPHESQHARPPCPSPTPGFHSGSRPLSHLILCRPLLLLTPIPPSIRVFSNESTLLMRWPKYWSFSFSIIPSKEIPGLISFRMEQLKQCPFSFSSDIPNIIFVVFLGGRGTKAPHPVGGW